MPRSDSGSYLEGAGRSDTPMSSDGGSRLAMHVLGVCGKPALRSIECTLIRYRQESPDAPLHMKLLNYEELPMPLQVRNLLLNILRDAQHNTDAIPRANALLGKTFSSAVRAFSQKHDISLPSVALVGIHPGIDTPSPPPGTTRTDDTSVAWNAIVASDTGLTTVTDFGSIARTFHDRKAPLVAVTNNQLLRHPTKFRVCLDINDYANLTFIPPETAGPDDAAATTTTMTTSKEGCGPGNMLIDYAMRYTTSNRMETDRDGTWAAHGTIHDAIVDQFLASTDYTHTSPPAEMLTEMFGDHEAQRVIDECLFLGLQPEDTIATITRITAQNLVRQYRRLLAAHCGPGVVVDDFFICGPGARNCCIVEYIESQLPATVITRPLDDIGINGDAKEALSCAQLGLEAVLAQASQSFAAGQRSLVRGKIMCGSTWDDVVQHVLRFGGGKPLPVLRRVMVDGASSSLSSLVSSSLAASSSLSSPPPSPPSPTRSAISIPELLSEPLPPATPRHPATRNAARGDVHME